MSIFLFNKTDFDRPYASPDLYPCLSTVETVTFLPLSMDEGWASDRMAYSSRFEEEGELHYDLERPFRSYGIRRFKWLDAMRDEPEDLDEGIEHAEFLCIVAEDAVTAMEQIEDLGLLHSIRSMRGSIMGLGAGAEILCSTITSLYSDQCYPGLGLLPGYGLDVEYEEEPEHLEKIIRFLQEREETLLILPREAGVILDEGRIEFLGTSFAASMRDLDEVYALYEELKCRD